MEHFAGITVDQTMLYLQMYWWVIVGVLGALFVFMMWVQGGQTLLGVASNEDEERVILNSLGRKWELTFTTLVLFGGALYAAFPLFYAISFGGAYWVWMLILLAFVVQAVAYEYYNKPGNMYGKGFYKFLLYFNGFVGTVLIGAAVGTFFTGSNFSYDAVTRTLQWGVAENGLNLRGLEAAIPVLNGQPVSLTLFNLSFGLMLFFLTRVVASLYFVNDIDDANLRAKFSKQAVVNTVLMLPFLLYVLFMIVTMPGMAYDQNNHFQWVDGKYLQNLLAFGALPLILLLAGVVLFLAGVYLGGLKQSRKGIWFAGLGVILIGLVIFIITGLNDTAFYPSYADPASSLTIQNSSGSKYTLETMAWVSISVPFVLLYIIYAWYQMNKKPITIDEVKNDHHSY